MKRIALSLGSTATAFALLAVTPGVHSRATLLAQDSASKPTSAPPANPAAPVTPGMQGPDLPAEFKPLFSGIALTDVQSRQVTQIAQKYATPPGQSDSSKAGMGAGAADQRLNAAKEFRTVLTPDQQKMFDKNLDKVKGSWGKRAY